MPFKNSISGISTSRFYHYSPYGTRLGRKDNSICCKGLPILAIRGGGGGDSNVNKNVCLLYLVLFQSFLSLSDPVRNFEKQFPIRRKLFPEPELLNHMACHDYTPNIGRSAAISVPGPRTSTPRYSSQPYTMSCRYIDEGVIGSGMGLFVIGY
jgi:hypothetical protein